MNVVVLAGGVGGARLLDGIVQAAEGDAVTAIVNTGDDLVHWGLHVSPDLDTVLYPLAGIAHEQRGWGLAGETFTALEGMRRLGGDAWFALGDRDLATHLARTEARARGDSLTSITRRLCDAFGVRTRVLPMTDTPRPTLIDTVDHGTLGFQEWLVRHRAPAVRGVRFDGAPPPTDDVVAALRAAELIVIAPSNPYVSIDPILTLPGVRQLVASRPVVAVSPIVAGAAVKGPLAHMIPSLEGVPASAAAIARHYAPLLRGFVVDPADAPALDGPAVLATDIIMHDRPDRARLAHELLAFARSLIQ
jgi:LPPG:FO 2-phospho-L-lactate transferase